MPHSPRNPADLLRLGSDPALIRLLLACGADEACVTGNASDYDKFLALAAAMPLCEGHPLRDAVNSILTSATGLSAPLCPHTARLHWDAWVEINLYDGRVTDTHAPTVCPYCEVVYPTVWYERDLARLSDPTEVIAPDLTAWSAALEASLPTDGTSAMLTLPDDYTFIRPDPYHANLAVRKLYRGDVLTSQERDLLMTQALRVWGLARTGKATLPLLLRGGDPIAVTALCAYLAASKALPSMTWIPIEPAHAEALCGLYVGVGTGYALRETDTPEEAEGVKNAYAKAAPMGTAAVIVRE